MQVSVDWGSEGRNRDQKEGKKSVFRKEAEIISTERKKSKQSNPLFA